MRPDERTSRLNDFEQRRAQLQGQMISATNSLGYGWQNRLTASVINAPQSFGMMTGRFNKEAAALYGAVNPMLGSTNTRDRDAWMFAGPHLADSLAGRINTPAGFFDTAMQGAHRPLGDHEAIPVRVVGAVDPFHQPQDPGATRRSSPAMGPGSPNPNNGRNGQRG